MAATDQEMACAVMRFLLPDATFRIGRMDGVEIIYATVEQVAASARVEIGKVAAEAPDSICKGCNGDQEQLNKEGMCGSCVELDAYVDEHGPLTDGYSSRQPDDVVDHDVTKDAR